MLFHYTFYSELCKYPQIARNYQDYFHLIFRLNSFSVWMCQRLLRVMEQKIIRLYISLYIVAFGTKRRIITLWNRKKTGTPAGGAEAAQGQWRTAEPKR